MNEDLKIGDFQRPLAETLPTPKKPPAAPLESQFDSAEWRIAAEADKAEKSLKPRETYEERLRQADVSTDEAALIVDAIIEQGFWEEEIKITSKKKARFRTRQALDAERVNNALETARPSYTTTQNELTYKYLLAASIASYGDLVFQFPKAADSRTESDKLFQKRLDWVNNLPDPLLRMLFTKLGTFDFKIGVVTAEGAIENF